MEVAVFSSKEYDREYLTKANQTFGHDLNFFEARLSRETAPLAWGFPCISTFVHDELTAPVIHELAQHGTKLVALRSAGFNNVDLAAAAKEGLTVVRVPAYSPHAVAEHTIALLLCLNRKLHRSYSRVREGNMALAGLMGFDLHGKTVGVVGMGNIGVNVARILDGFGLRVLAFDPSPSDAAKQINCTFVELDQLFRESDIITLHCPLTQETHHLINGDALGKMKIGTVLINTSRGALIDTPAVIEGLKSGQIAHLGLDVYEEEEDIFFEDLSDQVIQDDVFARLLTFPNVLVTGHQAFFTSEAVEAIASTTLGNIRDVEETGTCENLIPLPAERRLET